MIVFGTAIAMSAGMLAGCGSSKGGDSASVELMMRAPILL